MIKNSEDQKETMNFPTSMNSADADQLDGDLVYNVPDGLEDDPEIIRFSFIKNYLFIFQMNKLCNFQYVVLLRSELMFFNTPRNDVYSDYVYYTLKNIQVYCSNMKSL